MKRYIYKHRTHRARKENRGRVIHSHYIQDTAKKNAAGNVLSIARAYSEEAGKLIVDALNTQHDRRKEAEDEYEHTQLDKKLKEVFGGDVRLIEVCDNVISLESSSDITKTFPDALLLCTIHDDRDKYPWCFDIELLEFINLQIKTNKTCTYIQE